MIRNLRLCLPPLFYAFFISACDTAAQPQAAPQDPADVFAECVDLGFTPDTWEMSRCLEADTRVRRIVLADQATYGTF
mgnify:CR=1 FL=1